MESRFLWALPAAFLAAGLAAAEPAEEPMSEPLSDAEQTEMRMAVGQPAAPPAARPAPPTVRFQVEGVPPAGLRVGEAAPPKPPRLTRNQWGVVGLVMATALLVGLELRRHWDAG